MKGQRVGIETQRGHAHDLFNAEALCGKIESPPAKKQPPSYSRFRARSGSFLRPHLLTVGDLALGNIAPSRLRGWLNSVVSQLHAARALPSLLLPLSPGS